MTTPPPPASEPFDELDPDAVAALRARLRDEPIAVDDAARERAIAAALHAAPRQVTALDDVRPRTTQRRGSSARPVLVAAAVLAVLGIGAAIAVSSAGDRTGNQETASVLDDSTPAPLSDGADGAGGAATASSAEPPTARASEELGPTTTAAPFAESGSLVDLGSFDDTDALLDQAARLRTGVVAEDQDPAVEAGAADGADAPVDTRDRGASSCAEELSRLDSVPVATALVDGEPVLVAVQLDGGVVVLSATDCSELTRG